jgi:disulfide bond formation protein DsbB
MERISDASPRRNARIAGVFYLLTFLAGLPAFFLRGSVGLALGLIAGACYIVVTLLFYYLFRPVNRSISLLAAFVSLVGCAIGPAIDLFHLAIHINPLVFFGFYCLLIGYLIFRSRFMPRILGALMAFAGLGWLTFFSAHLAHHLQPYNLVPGFIGEGALTLWLLVIGVNSQRWKEQASAAEVRA